jgi:hypothetical protein
MNTFQSQLSKWRWKWHDTVLIQHNIVKTLLCRIGRVCSDLNSHHSHLEKSQYPILVAGPPLPQRHCSPSPKWDVLKMWGKLYRSTSDMVTSTSSVTRHALISKEKEKHFYVSVLKQLLRPSNFSASAYTLRSSGLSTSPQKVI